MSDNKPIDLSVIDAKDLNTIQNKKTRANWVLDVIKENNLDKDKEFMGEIEPLIEELLKEAKEVEKIEDDEE